MAKAGVTLTLANGASRPLFQRRSNLQPSTQGWGKLVAASIMSQRGRNAVAPAPAGRQ